MQCLPAHTDIRCDLAPQLVAEAQPGLRAGQAGAKPLLRHISQTGVDLGPRLQLQALREQHFVFELAAQADVSILAYKKRNVGFEPLRRETLRDSSRLTASSFLMIRYAAVTGIT